LHVESAEPRRREATRGTLVAIAVGALALLAAGFTVGFVRGDGDDAAAGDWAGTVLSEPLEKPAIVLSDTNGRAYDLRAETEGKLTVLFFGYTSCPDVCPASLHTIDKTLATMPADVRANTEVVFVSVDPERDSPGVIRRYLDGFDRAFVGLTGTSRQLLEAQDVANVPRSTFEEPDEDGFYLVGHATQMIAYSPDGVARIVYPFGTRQSDWARDLPRLVAGEFPDAPEEHSS
jgi:protein SCO1/2